MKEHTDLTELLEAYDEYCRIAPPLWDGIKCREKFVASNSLALGKPEPLVKNKHSGNKCEHRNRTQHFSDVFGVYESCLDCGKDL